MTLLVLTLVAPALGCSSAPARPGLPPSATDLPLLQGIKICEDRERLLKTRGGPPDGRAKWGTGEELRFTAPRGELPATESYFLDEDGLLVGFLIMFRHGLPLEPYPVLRETLSKLRPSIEFYQNISGLSSGIRPKTVALYLTGQKRNTTQYLVRGKGDSSELLLASDSIDPYADLLSPFRQEFLKRLPGGPTSRQETEAAKVGSDDRERFESLQQFARGETALLEYCGLRKEAIAAEAYRKAIEEGITSKKRLAEAHHKLALSLQAQGDLDGALQEMQQSLEIVPNRPSVLNNLGEIYEQRGDKPKAIAAFEQAIRLKPNYAIARFNLAEAYEQINRRRAIDEYETYLALVEGIPEEAVRANRARTRVETLKR